MTLAATCGQLVIGGFPGATLSAVAARALRERRRGGVILFKPNLAPEAKDVAAALAGLTREVHAAAPDPPFVGIDQEGGRVARLRAPFLKVPPMQTVASWGDVAFAERIARAVGAELAAIGITIDFAPVLDVNTRPTNPVIGDRAFASDAPTCAAFGAAWVRGLQSAGVLACGKHFPGHGDTTKDSHLDLPFVDQPWERIDRVELTPFRAAVAEGIAAIMSAHVVYPAIDPTRPATLSPEVCGRLRSAVGFTGLLVSDDLEMRAIEARYAIEDAAIAAIAAGCDVLLVCWSEDKQERAVDALIREASSSPAFRARCEEACARSLVARRRAGPIATGADWAAVVDGPESRAVAAAIEARSS
ncbi:MAG TPA: beta-N-acetylhexosaminidase [Polyangiaceae bacterium]|jgi:beta-N-acetylhexosaminidase|nr:beta-N-acetylhexosaminidase [Polyangiaceae bacterium]